MSTVTPPWLADNGIGFRDAFSVGKHCTVVVGDSFAMGWGVDDAVCFVEVAERTLGQPIHNLGVSGYGPQQAFDTLEHMGLGAGPKVVVWAFYGNDLEDAALHAWWAADRGQPWPATKTKSAFELALNRYSATYKLFRFLGRRKSVDRRPWRDGERSFLFSPYWRNALDLRHEHIRQGFALTCQELERFVALAAKHAFAPVVLAVPYREQVYREEYATVDPSPDPSAILEAGYTQVLDHARSLGIEVLDALPLLREHKAEMVYLWEDPHWSIAGHRIVGDALAQLLHGRLAR